ncbi:MAG: putative quinol monooxygenase [Actinomycetota bacterium]|nr:putative quinol monooxygenase [Actinomycetota bacterium]
MIVVQGVFRVAAEDREQFLAQSVENQRISRSEKGCIEYVLAADPLEPDRVVLSERWETKADLDAHLEALRQRRRAPGTNAAAVEPISREVSFLEATAIDLT